MRLEFNLSKVDLKNEDWQRALARMVGVDDLYEPPLSFVSGRVLWVDFLALWKLKAQDAPLDRVPSGTISPGKGHPFQTWLSPG